MKSVLLTFLIAGLYLGSAMAQDLGTSREFPVKNTPVVTYEPPPVPRQGGDSIEDATVIPGLPYSDTGTTEGYIDDYDEECPYTGSTAPDVVYRYTSEFTGGINVDLCESSYDTKVYIYDESMNLIACNDDFYFGDPCWVYSSRIENAPVIAGKPYFIVIDGYGGSAGDYVLSVAKFERCYVHCPYNAVPEGEPPLHDGYQDHFNGGCDSPEFGYPFQIIDWVNLEWGHPLGDYRAWLCGKSGWYLTTDGTQSRDTDWFLVDADQTGLMEITIQADYLVDVFKLSERNCADVEVEFYARANCENQATLAFPVSAGELIWLMVAPAVFEGTVSEFSYFMTVSNVFTGGCIPTERKNWGGVKALYR